jgi:hypothetical protein
LIAHLKVGLALGEVDGLVALLASTGFVEFVGKNFHFLPAFRALAGKGLQVFVRLKTRTMLGCVGHRSLLS